MMISRITKTVAVLGAATLMSSTAYAGCNNSLYCSDGGHGHNSSSVSSYEGVGYGGTVTLPGTHNYSSGSVTLPGTHNYSSSYGSSYSSSMSDSQADSMYGSGSISGAYVDHSSVGSTYSSSTISNLSIPGLGANERLCPTSCDTGINVHGANGKRVLGCYKVCQPVQVHTPAPIPVQNYVRVVRPIVYVRYPVPVPVPTACSVPVTTWGARYLDHGTRGCGW